MGNIGKWIGIFLAFVAAMIVAIILKKIWEPFKMYGGGGVRGTSGKTDKDIDPRPESSRESFRIHGGGAPDRDYSELPIPTLKMVPTVPKTSYGGPGKSSIKVGYRDEWGRGKENFRVHGGGLPRSGGYDISKTVPVFKGTSYGGPGGSSIKVGYKDEWGKGKENYENYTSPGGCADYDNEPGDCKGKTGLQIALKCDLGRSELNRDIWCKACDKMETPTEWTVNGEKKKVLCSWRAVNISGYYINLILENECESGWKRIESPYCRTL